MNNSPALLEVTQKYHASKKRGIFHDNSVELTEQKLRNLTIVSTRYLQHQPSDEDRQVDEQRNNQNRQRHITRQHERRIVDRQKR